MLQCSYLGWARLEGEDDRQDPERDEVSENCDNAGEERAREVVEREIEVEGLTGKAGKVGP